MAERNNCVEIPYRRSMFVGEMLRLLTLSAVFLELNIVLSITRISFSNLVLLVTSVRYQKKECSKNFVPHLQFCFEKSVASFCVNYSPTVDFPSIQKNY